MKVPSFRLEIHQITGKVGLETTPSTFQIDQRPADLQIRQIPADLKIQRTPAVLIIDYRPANTAYGQRGIVDFMTHAGDQAHLQVLDNIGSIAQDGDRMMDITNKQDAFADLAFQHQFDQSVIQDTDPPSANPVPIRVNPSVLDVKWQKNGVQIQANYFTPKITATAGALKVYVREEPSISVHAVGGYVDTVR
ncbi:DUF6470 family protein [Effusibacillus dendaii]|uniref:Uncharacterized protein n=1 Tax=Effusibacillus dendaii TaxID=2743772 RepID=A0A7I8DG67_9BACL|nr:DUF6470 family protein [Effusibacillus dendaii]BCJ87866.1 hypothetical protein skT53_28510 [Effusibacillus dendaii]